MTFCYNYITESLYRVTQISRACLEIYFKKTFRLHLFLSFYSLATDSITTFLVDDTFIGQGLKYSPVNLKFSIPVSLFSPAQN